MAEQDTHPNSALFPIDSSDQQQDSQEHLIDSENVLRMLAVLGEGSDTDDKKSKKVEPSVEDFSSGIPKKANEKVKSPVTYASFGENGTTASVNSYSAIIQMTRFLGMSTSGFFSVDQFDVAKPNYIKLRAHELEEKCKYHDGLNWGSFWSEMSENMIQISRSNAPWEMEFVHDRWPRLTSETSGGLRIIINNFVSKGTVFQEAIHETKEEPESIISGKKRWIIDLSDYRIRELNFKSSDDSGPSQDDPYESYVTSNELGLILIQKKFSDQFEKDAVENPHAVCLITSISINGKVQKLEKMDGYTSSHLYQIKVQDPEGFAVKPKEPVTITQAFRLQLITKKKAWIGLKEIGIPDSEFYHYMDEILQLQPSFAKLTFAQHQQHLDFMIRRNLEHILSVCSIPIPGRGIALTCGDMSGHRLVISASFFEFKFLLAMYDYLEKYPEQHHGIAKVNSKAIEVNNCRECLYSKNLCSRIRNMCEKHLEWVNKVVLVKVKRQIEKEEVIYPCFGGSYWATGELIEGENEYETQPLAPMHFQLLKLADAAIKWKGGDVKTWLKNNVKLWIKELDYRNEQGFFAFSTCAASIGEDSKYRLEDHVWIWRLLKSVEELGLANTIQKAKPNQLKREFIFESEAMSTEKSERAKKAEIKRDYSSAEFRRQVLRRFTTENTVSGRRMLAVRRSASLNRFEFRARDTALFYDRETAFFTGSEALWNATTDCQQLHVNNQDSGWHDPLRYALALLMGAIQNLQINSRSAANMSEVARTVLYQGSSANGLLPGRLNMGTKEPEIFQIDNLRDYYWHVSFEVPYALLKCLQDTPTQQSPPLEPGDVPAGPRIRTLVPTVPGQVFHASKNLEMKRNIPFNTLIDQDSIVEFSDEWLYPRPGFLDWEPPELTSESYKAIAERIRGKEWTRGANVDNFAKSDDSKPSDLRGIIVDIPKTKFNITRVKLFESQDLLMDPILGREQPSRNRNAYKAMKQLPLPLSNYGMYDALKGKRTADKAKKRLIWCFKENPDTALLCYLVSPPADQDRLSLFFTKHERREKFFFDDTTATENLWVTEFHLSSWQMFTEKEYGKMEVKETDLNFLGGGNRIRRACMGFHFVGDFFDRYWTCHVFEQEPKNDAKPKIRPENKQTEKTKEEEEEKARIKESFRKLIDVKNSFGSVPGKTPWHQRKVLELLLFHRMLENITRRYTQLLTAVNESMRDLKTVKARREEKKPKDPSLEPWKSLSLHVSKDLPSDAPLDILSASNELFSSELNYDTYSTFRDKMPAFQYSLQVMEEDLKDTFEKIDLWNAREKDRKLERPRWTKNDESRYRSTIAKVSAANDHKIRDLQRYLSNIQSLRVSLTARLESARDDLAFKSAENVRFFTYVTVVFLPMGFATALFSMNVPPAARLVGEMVGAAFVTLMVTAIALGYAKEIDQSIVTPLGERLPRPWGRSTKDNTPADTPSSTSSGDGQNTSPFNQRGWLRNGSESQNKATEGVNANNPNCLEEGRGK